jgi:hypothetical protein
VTRVKETCTRAITLPAGGFTVLYDLILPIAAANNFETAGAISDGAFNNAVEVYWGASGMRVDTYGETPLGSGIYLSASLDVAPVTPLKRFKLAVRVQPSQFAVALNGVLFKSASAFSPLLSLLIQEDLASEVNGSQWHGHVLGSNALATIWRTPVSDADLIAMSTLS